MGLSQKRAGNWQEEGEVYKLSTIIFVKRLCVFPFTNIFEHQYRLRSAELAAFKASETMIKALISEEITMICDGFDSIEPVD